MSLRNERFGEILRRWRDDKGLTQSQLADSVGLAQRTVSQWETRGMAFDAAKLRLLDKAFGFPPGTAATAYLESADAPSVDMIDDEVVADLLKRVANLEAALAQIRAEKSSQGQRSR